MSNATPEECEKYYKKMYRLCCSIIKNEEDAKDVCQDAFLNIISNLHQFQNKHSLGSWIYIITKRQALYFLRTKKRFNEIKQKLKKHENISKNVSNPESLLLNRHREEKIKEICKQAMKELPKEYKEPIELRYWHDLPNKTVAYIVNASLLGTKSRIHRSKLRMQENIKASLKNEIF